MGGEYRPLDKRHEGSHYPRGEKGWVPTSHQTSIHPRGTQHTTTRRAGMQVHRFNERQPQGGEAWRSTKGVGQAIPPRRGMNTHTQHTQTWETPCRREPPVTDPHSARPHVRTTPRTGQSQSRSGSVVSRSWGLGEWGSGGWRSGGWRSAGADGDCQ